MCGRGRIDSRENTKMKFSWDNVIKLVFLLFYVFVSCSSSSISSSSSSEAVKPILIETKKLSLSVSGSWRDDDHDDHGKNITPAGNIMNSTMNMNLNASYSPLVENKASVSGGTIPPSRTRGEITLVPTWIRRQRATKVLEKPLESQLLHFKEGDGERETRTGANDREKLMESNLFSLSSSSRPSSGNTTTSLSLSHSSASPSSPVTSKEIPVVRVAGVQHAPRHDNLIPLGILQRRRLRTKVPSRKQDIDLISLVGEVPGALPPPPPPPSIEFTSAVSPLEASLGGLTGLQGLPPLSFVQFIRLLVAVTPFIIPIIFIPLLLFSIGILMIPVTRSNVFVDVGDLRQASKERETINQNSFISSYLVSPVKKFTGSVVMPRAYQFANDIISEEQCIERICCEISAKYLDPSEERNGSWRSVARNNAWISRIITFLGEKSRTISRISKSLRLFDSRNLASGKVEEMGDKSKNESTTGGFSRNNIKEDEDVHEISGNREHNSKSDTSEGSGRAGVEHETSFINDSACRKYVCQPKALLRRMFS